MNFPGYGGIYNYAVPIIGFSFLFSIAVIIFVWVTVTKSFKLFF